MLLRLLLLFTVVPLVELTLLLWLADVTSWQVTLAVVLVTGVLGAWLARWQGWRTIRRIQTEMAEGHMPADAMLDGLLILVAGAVLITPGILTDAVGFALLVPLARTPIKGWLRRRFRTSLGPHGYSATWGESGPPGERHDEIIDVRVITPPSSERPPSEGQ